MNLASAHICDNWNLLRVSHGHADEETLETGRSLSTGYNYTRHHRDAFWYAPLEPHENSIPHHTYRYLVYSRSSSLSLSQQVKRLEKSQNQLSSPCTEMSATWAEMLDAFEALAQSVWVENWGKKQTCTPKLSLWCDRKEPPQQSIRCATLSI